MHEKLAAMYNTNGVADQIHMIKIAHLDILHKLAQDQDVEISDEELEELYDGYDTDELEEITSGALEEAGYDPQATYENYEGPEMEPTEEEIAEEVEKESSAKLAEADHAGRVMAHAYVNELDSIAEERDKTAGKGTAIMKALKGAVANPKARYARAGEAASEAFGKGQRGFKRRAAGAGRALKAVAPEAAGAAALAAGAKAVSGKGKESSAFETMAQVRAQEIIDHYGLQKQASTDEQFEEALNARAIEMLEADGWVQG